MSRRNNEFFDDEEENEEPSFQRLRKQGEKSVTIKGDRRQQEKEWGRQIAKFHKQRPKNGKP